MGIIFLVLFGVTLFSAYITIRRGWAETFFVGSVTAVLSILFIVLFALISEHTSAGQAIFAGLVVGLGFTGATVAIATFFKANQPPAKVALNTSRRFHDEDDLDV